LKALSMAQVQQGDILRISCITDRDLRQLRSKIKTQEIDNGDTAEVVMHSGIITAKRKGVKSIEIELRIAGKNIPLKLHEISDYSCNYFTSDSVVS
jgi:hypothetical protein